MLIATGAFSIQKKALLGQNSGEFIPDRASYVLSLLMPGAPYLPAVRQSSDSVRNTSAHSGRIIRITR